MRQSLACLLSAAVIAAASAAHADGSPVADRAKAMPLPTVSCIFDRWGNLRTSGSGACRLDASKKMACTMAGGVVSTLNGATVCTIRQQGAR